MCIQGWTFTAVPCDRAGLGFSIEQLEIKQENSEQNSKRKIKVENSEQAYTVPLFYVKFL